MVSNKVIDRQYDRTGGPTRITFLSCILILNYCLQDRGRLPRLQLLNQARAILSSYLLEAPILLQHPPSELTQVSNSHHIPSMHSDIEFLPAGSGLATSLPTTKSISGHHEKSSSGHPDKQPRGSTPSTASAVRSHTGVQLPSHSFNAF